jgi:hypothetical protein
MNASFLLLVRHFFGRFFDNEIVSQQGDMRTNVVQTLGFVAVPGMFAAFAMLPTGVRFDQPFANGWELVIDYYFFSMYSMVVMGFVMVFEWDALFPDRKDYIILTPLPLGETAIFFAKVAALILFLGFFVLDANILGMALCPLISAGNFTAAPVVARVAAAHAAAVLSGGIFVALVFAGLQGLLINCLTARAFRRVSPWVQMASMAFLITILFLTPQLAGSIRPLFEQHSPLLRYFPPFWFLALYMELLPGRPGGALFHDIAPLATRAVGAAAAVFAVTYFAGYWRHARRIMESTEITGDPPGRLRAAFDRLVNAYLLPHPLERATFHFISSTILRSARHRLFLATYGGIAIALALPNLVWLGTRPGAPSVVFTAAGLLPVPLILTFLCVMGLRGAFNLPAELRANWVFQTAESEERVPHIRAARKWVVTMGLAPVLLALLPIEIAYRGWWGIIHLTFALAMALVLLNVLLVWFRKIPLTCSYFPGKMSMAAMALVFILGYLFYVTIMSRLEARWLHEPAGLIAYYLAAIGALAGLRWLEGRELQVDDVLIYEDQPDPEVRTLELG